MRRGDKGEHEFGVNHYAGTVYYDVRGFSEKNKDELMLQVRELLQSSRLPFLQYLFSDEAREATLAARAAASEGKAKSGEPTSPAPGAKEKTQRGGADKETQSTQFRGQLDALMKTLNTTEPHFIRCIKPNNVKKGNIFDAPVCLQQLRYAGVFEAVKVRQLGFPFRWTYDIFYKRYRVVAENRVFRQRIAPSGFPWREKCRSLLDDVSVASPEILAPVAKVFKFGKTMLLYRADQHRILEMIRDHVRDDNSRFCQRVYRGHVKRKLCKVLRLLREKIRAAIKLRELLAVQAALAEGSRQPFRLFIMKELVAVEARLLEEKAARETLLAIYPLDPADPIHFTSYENALKEARRLALTAEDVFIRAHIKFATVKDRIETKENLTKGIKIGDKALILKSLAKAEELKKDWGDIVPPEQIEAAKEMMLVIALEERVQEALKESLKTGGPRGAIGALDCSDIDVSGLEAAVAAATSGRVAIKTAYGANLIATCSMLRDLRLALRGGVWRTIETAVAAASKLRAEDRLTEEASDEVRMAEAEVADRRIQNELVQIMSGGAPRGAARAGPRGAAHGPASCPPTGSGRTGWPLHRAQSG